MGRQAVPEAGPRHPARKILKERTPKEVADALGVKVSTVYAFGRSLKVTAADRIVEAFSGKPAPEKLKPEKTPKYAPPEHRAWTILELFPAEEISARCEIRLRDIEGTAENGLTTKLADKIAAAYPDLSEDRMKEVLREAASAGEGDGTLPYLREPVEMPDQEEPPSAGPCRTWVDPSVKKTPDLLAQLLQVEGAVLIVPLAGLVKLKGGT